jgi:hypothetical protein
VYVQLGAQWYARNDRWKLTERGDLFDMSDAPHVQKPVLPDTQSADVKAAREQLQAALDKLNPAGGITDTKGKKADGEKKAAKKDRKKAKKAK